MKLLAFFLLAFGLHASAKLEAQHVTLNLRNVSIQTVFTEVSRQTGISIVYSESQLDGLSTVSISVKDASVEEVLSQCFKNQPLRFTKENGLFMIAKVAAPSTPSNKDIPPPITVKGRITNANGEPVVASIQVKGSSHGTTSNAEGYYELTNVDESATIVISGVSIETQELKVNKRILINISTTIKIAEGEEVVVAYNKISSRSNVGAVTVVKGKDIRTLPTMSVDKRLQGLVPGLLVTSGSGQPGSGLSNFVLRGINTADNGMNGSTLRNPLIVIDGIPVSQDAQQLRSPDFNVPVNNPMAQLNPSDIESISVLKDAAAIALYGSKASNGVILITTKQGKEGKTQFSFRHQTDIAQRLKGKMEYLNEPEFMELLFETYRNSVPGMTTDAIIQDLKSQFPVRSDGSFYPFENVANLIYNDAATTNTDELSVSGGNNRSTFYLNLENTKQNGTYRKTGYDRKSFRFNFTNNATSWLKLGINTGFSYNVQNYVPAEGGPFGFGDFAAPMVPIHLENGEYLLSLPPFATPNPVAAMEYNSSRNTNYRGLTKLSADARFLKWFQFSTLVGADIQFTEAKEKKDPRLFDPLSQTTGVGTIIEGSYRNATIITTNRLSFTKTFRREHFLNALIAQEAQVLTQKTSIATGTGLSFHNLDQIDNTAIRTSTGRYNKQTLLSYFGQANYSYKNKYFLSSSVRFDGSSKFGSNQRFGTYWSTGLGWELSSEPFMRSTKSWLNYLKIRGSVGAAGNSGPIDKYTKYSTLLSGFYLDPNTIYLDPTGGLANPGIKWEQSFNLDAGLELKVWKERIGLTADIYQRKTSDLIYVMSIPLNSGTRSISTNIGDMMNKGIEIGLNASLIKTKNFSWIMTANWSTNQNKLVKSNVKFSKVAGTVSNEEGRNFNSYYMPVWAGVNPATGAGMWIDSTGKPSSNYSAAKYEWVGKPQPDGFGAVIQTFRYKNLQLSAQFYYQYGYQDYTSSLIDDGGFPYNNRGKQALDRWKKPGDIARNPKRTLDNYNAGLTSTRWLVNADHIRFQNVSLAYTVPQNLVNLLHLTSLTFYAQINNLAIWSIAGSVDPSNVNAVGLNAASYPNSRTYSIGINLNF